MGARLVCVVSGVGKPWRERGDQAAEASEAGRDEEVETGAEDPEADDGRQSSSNESFSGPVLGPARHQIEEWRIEIGALEDGGPGGVKGGQTAEIDGEELVVPEGFERGP
jgi:hypothetical protein